MILCFPLAIGLLCFAFTSLNTGFYVAGKGPTASDAPEQLPGTSRDTVELTVIRKKYPKNVKKIDLAYLTAFYGLEKGTLQCTIERAEGPVQDLAYHAGRELRENEIVTLCLNR